MSSGYAWDKWVEILKTEIKNSRPVIYGGTSDSGKHAFVCDGYDKDGLIHINWGWDGNSNGYFSLKDMPYSSDATMIINLEPDLTGKEYGRPYCTKDAIYSLLDEADFINVSVPEIKSGEAFEISSPGIRIPYRFDGDLGFALVDKNNEIKEIISKYRIYGTGEQNYEAYGGCTDFRGYGCVIQSEIQAEDKIHLVARESTEDPWKLILGCSAVPSSVSVNNCNSIMSVIEIECDEQIELRYNEVNSDNIIDFVLSDNQPVRKLFGSDLQCRFNLKPNLNGYGKVTIIGKGPYGDESTYLCVKNDEESFGYKLIDVNYRLQGKYYEYSEPQTVNVETPGTLKDLIDIEASNRMCDLTVTGAINAFDLWYIRDNMKGLQKLNLESAEIVGVATQDVYVNGFKIDDYQEDNTMPNWALNGMHLLEEVILPQNLKFLSNMCLTELNIRKIKLPASIEGFGLNNFFACANLTIIENLSPTPMPIKDCNFTGTNCPTEGALIVPEASIPAYKEAEIWKDFKSFFPLGTILPEKVIIENTEISLGLGESYTPVVSFYPENVSERKLTYKDYDESVITITSDGVINAVGVGHTMITVRSEIGGTAQYIFVTVYEDPIRYLQIEPDFIEGTVNDEKQLDLIIVPENATNKKDIIWSSSDDNIVEVDENGKIKLCNPGSATIMATCGEIFAKCEVTVNSPEGELENVVADFGYWDIYNSQGILVKKQVLKTEVENLSSGVYILTNGKDVVKFVK